MIFYPLSEYGLDISENLTNLDKNGFDEIRISCFKKKLKAIVNLWMIAKKNSNFEIFEDFFSFQNPFFSTSMASIYLNFTFLESHSCSHSLLSPNTRLMVKMAMKFCSTCRTRLCHTGVTRGHSFEYLMSLFGDIVLLKPPKSEQTSYLLSCFMEGNYQRFLNPKPSR